MCIEPNVVYYINESLSKIAFSVLATALELFGFSEVAIDRHYAGAVKSQIKESGECFIYYTACTNRKWSIYTATPQGHKLYHDIISWLSWQDKYFSVNFLHKSIVTIHPRWYVHLMHNTHACLHAVHCMKWILHALIHPDSQLLHNAHSKAHTIITQCTFQGTHTIITQCTFQGIHTSSMLFMAQDTYTHTHT